MELCVDIVLTFQEAMSVLTNTTTAPLDYFTDGRWKAENLLFPENFRLITHNAYNWTYATPNDEGMKNLPFLIYDNDTHSWSYTQIFQNFVNYLFKEYGHSYCVVAKDDTAENLVKASITFLDDLMNKFFETYDKYAQMFEYYETLKGNLLKGVKSTTSGQNVSKFKDTPQGAVTLETLGDDYNSNVNTYDSKSTFEDDRETPVERLQEIENKLSNLYGEWAYNFKMFFWEV